MKLNSTSSEGRTISRAFLDNKRSSLFAHATLTRPHPLTLHHTTAPALHLNMASATKAKEKTAIFSLPIEIRNNIWHYVLEDNTKQCTRKRRTRPCRFCIDRCPPYHEPAVLQVSRQVRSETQSVWYGTATFYFHDGSDKLLEFLVFLGNHKTSKIANLVDEPSFGKPSFARKFLEEVYHKVRALGIQLNEGAIEVMVCEGTRLLKSTMRKDAKIIMRKTDMRGVVVAPEAISRPREQASASSEFDVDEGSWSETTLPNSDAESDGSMS